LNRAASEPEVRDAIAALMRRIYRAGMTTTSGGNISVRDGNGTIWITPAGRDKGALRGEEIPGFRADGAYEGHHPPSSELPFHRAIYAARPDLGAVIHAHPAALVAFSIVRQRPDLQDLPEAAAVCGRIGYANYATPGEEELGTLIAEEFRAGCDAVIMENHATVVGGKTLEDAILRFETFEHAAQVLIRARALGHVTAADGSADRAPRAARPDWPEAPPPGDPEPVDARREELAAMARRSAAQGLTPAALGCLSLRLGADDFLVTPGSVALNSLQPGQIVRIRQGCREPGPEPHASAVVHRAIYLADPVTAAIVMAQPRDLMAFAVAGVKPDMRTIPESWILLRDLPLLPAGSALSDPDGFARRFGRECPAVLVRKEGIYSTGASILEAFDRLEVAEFSARSLILGRSVGDMRPIEEPQVEALRRKFFPS
jgi:L-fuculose-phosphate aldolase